MSEDLKVHYASLEAEELLRLASMGEGLREDARSVLEVELRSRGVQLPAAPAEPIQDDSPQAERGRAAGRVVIMGIGVLVIAVLAQGMSSLLKSGHYLLWGFGLLAIGVLWFLTKPSKKSKAQSKS